MKNNDALLATLRMLSAKTKFSMTEICEIARTIAQIKCDPLPPEAWGEAFEELLRVCVFDDDDFCTLVDPVPPPDAQIDLFMAWHEYISDHREAEYALRRKLSIDQLLLVARNVRHWCRFWSVRCPDKKVRAAFRAKLAELESAAALNGAKAERLLRKRGVTAGDETTSARVER